MLDAPASFPHATVLGNGGRCVLLGELPTGGDVYVGETEMRLAGPLLGWQPPEEVERLMVRISALEGELQRSFETIDRIRREALAAA